MNASKLKKAFGPYIRKSPKIATQIEIEAHMDEAIDRVVGEVVPKKVKGTKDPRNERNSQEAVVSTTLDENIASEKAIKKLAQDRKLSTNNDNSWMRNEVDEVLRLLEEGDTMAGKKEEKDQDEGSEDDEEELMSNEEENELSWEEEPLFEIELSRHNDHNYEPNYYFRKKSQLNEKMKEERPKRTCGPPNRLTYY